VVRSRSFTLRMGPHGRRFCGHPNHEEEANKPPPLIWELASLSVGLTALDLNSGATLAFAVCKSTPFDPMSVVSLV
jgi:hypothetical protein